MQEDKKKIYLYATPLAFIFGLIFGTLFLAYSVIAQTTSYFNNTSFVLRGGQIVNNNGAKVAFSSPSGAVGIGMDIQDVKFNDYKLDIAGDIYTDSSLTAESITVSGNMSVNNITSQSGGAVNINGNLNVVGDSHFTGGNYVFEITDNGQMLDLNLEDLFNIEVVGISKIWTDGSAFEWINGHVYGVDKLDLTIEGYCSGEKGQNGYDYAYKVYDNVWWNVECQSNPTPPSGGVWPNGCQLE